MDPTVNIIDEITLNFFISASLIPGAGATAAEAEAEDDPTVAALFNTLGVA